MSVSRPSLSLLAGVRKSDAVRGVLLFRSGQSESGDGGPEDRESNMGEVLESQVSDDAVQGSLQLLAEGLRAAPQFGGQVRPRSATGPLLREVAIVAVETLPHRFEHLDAD